MRRAPPPTTGPFATLHHVHKVFVDANVLYSRTLRDWLFILRQEAGNTFSVHTTEDVITEAVYHLRRNNQQWRGRKTKQLRERLVASLDEVVGDYDPTIEYPFKDENDRHVHAAAVECRADFLLTGDGGFQAPKPDAELPYEVHTPDEFFLLVDDSNSDAVMRATNRQREYWQKKAKAGETPMSLASALVEAKCPKFAKRVEGHLRALSGLRRELEKKKRLAANSGTASSTRAAPAAPNR